MKVLLDECVPERFRFHLRGHEVHSVRFAGFGGKKNGELLRLANSAGYQVLITVDQGIPYQQSLHGLSIALIVLAVPSNDLNTLTPMAHSILGVPEFVAAGAVVMLNCAPAGQG